MSETYLPLLRPVRDRLTGPTLILMGAPGTVADLVATLGRADTVCYQMDRYQGNRLAELLSDRNLEARVAVAADVWDLPEQFASAVLPSPERGERELKLDLVEQSFHVLQENGLLAVLSPTPKDELYLPLLKKIFGKASFVLDREGTTFWASRHGDHKRRRHEVEFTAKVREKEYIPFVSRPGVFAYGRLDDGSKSILDVLESRTGERIVELGCGCGAVGVIAALRGGEYSHVTLADSNLRAVAVAEENARRHGLTNYLATGTTDFSNLPAGSFDLALANPPYFAQHAISRMFIERSHALLRRGGRMYFVTRQFDQVEVMVEEYFPEPLVVERRGYAVLVCTKR